MWCYWFNIDGKDYKPLEMIMNTCTTTQTNLKECLAIRSGNIIFYTQGQPKYIVVES